MSSSSGSCEPRAQNHQHQSRSNRAGVEHIAQAVHNPEALSENQDMTKEETVSLITKIFENEFEDFKQELKQAAAPPRKKKEQKFKYESNAKQHEFNNSVLEELEGVTKMLDAGSARRPKRRIQDAISLLKTRNKHIKIADRSTGGWATVAEYVTDDLASDSEDEKKIKGSRNLRPVTQPPRAEDKYPYFNFTQDARR